jgi:hypothetical protein
MSVNRDGMSDYKRQRIAELRAQRSTGEEEFAKLVSELGKRSQDNQYIEHELESFGIYERSKKTSLYLLADIANCRVNSRLLFDEPAGWGEIP